MMKRIIRGILLCAGAGLATAGALGPASSAPPQLSALQGAWLQQSTHCDDVYTSSGKAMSFKKSVNEFDPAFIVSGARLKTPVNSCRIGKIVPAGNRWMMKLDCTGKISTMVANIQFSLTADGALLRYLNDQDPNGSRYERCTAKAARAPS
jgi:hypothetical protein